MTNVAVICGSLRKDSINRKLANGIVKLLPAGFTPVEVDISKLPLYNMDYEGARPAEVTEFTNTVRGCNAIILVTPEHNRSVTAAVKNAIDWGSLPLAESVWRNKVVFITGCSPGAVGGAPAHQHAKQIFGGILGAHVVPGEAFIQFKDGLITETGEIGEASKGFLQGHIDNLVKLTKALF